MSRSKNQKNYREKIDRNRRYGLAEAVKILKDNKFTKFDESIELAMRLGVNPKHADQMVRGTVSLPHGIGKTVRVAVFAAAEKAEEARAAGADEVGTDDLAAKIKGGWTDFDVCVATPDQMRVVGQLGKVLGPRGLMPNPKTGTVTMNLEQTIKELKAGRIEFRVDKQSNIAASIGKISFGENEIEENARAFVDAILKARPATTKGTYVLGCSICSTMSPGIKLDTADISSSAK